MPPIIAVRNEPRRRDFAQLCKAVAPDACKISVCLDLDDFSLLSRCDETAPLDRHLKGAGNSCRRLLSFFRDLLPTRCSSTRRLEWLRSERADYPAIGLVQSVGTRISCRRRLHHPKRLDADAINDATR